MTAPLEILNAGFYEDDPKDRDRQPGYYRDADGTLYRVARASWDADLLGDPIQKMAPGDIDPAATIHHDLDILELHERLRINDPSLPPMPMLAQDIGIEPDICPGCQHQIIWRYHWSIVASGGRLFHSECAPTIKVDCENCDGGWITVPRSTGRFWRPVEEVAQKCGRCRGEGFRKEIAP